MRASGGGAEGSQGARRGRFQGGGGEDREGEFGEACHSEGVSEEGRGQ